MFPALSRLLSKDVLLYTEMITTGALVFGDREHYLQPELLPGRVSYQLGGSDPKDPSSVSGDGIYPDEL